MNAELLSVSEICDENILEEQAIAVFSTDRDTENGSVEDGPSTEPLQGIKNENGQKTRRANGRDGILSSIASAIFTIWTILGALLFTKGTLNLPGGTLWSTCFITVWGLILFFILKCLISWLFSFIKQASAVTPKTINCLDQSSHALVLISRCALLFVAWLPYLLLSLPGTIHGDYVVQLLQHFGSQPLSNHHPVITTYLYGLLYDIGEGLFGVDGGILLTVLFQAFLLSLSLAFAITTLERYSQRHLPFKYFLLFFALVPIFPMFAFDCIKDTIACSFFVFLFTQMCSRYLFKGDNYPFWISAPTIVASGFFCSLLRNNYSYCIVPALFVLFMSTGGLRKAVYSSVSIIIALSVWNQLILGVLGVEKGDLREALSVPMQQIAYCLITHPDDFTPEELSSIQSLLTINLDDLPSRYSYKISDPVKNAFSLNERGDFYTFAKAWVSVGSRHPKSYLTAFLRGSYGYWYPFLPVGEIKWSNTLSIRPEDYIASLEKEGMVFSDSRAQHLLQLKTWNRAYRDSLRDAITYIGSIPPFCLLFEPALYIWACLLLSAYLMCVKKCGAPFVLCGLLFLTCCASPDYSNVRYALPFFALLPLLLIFSMIMPQIEKPNHRD